MNYIGEEVHLDNEETMEWIEIGYETLREYFEELGVGKTNEGNGDDRLKKRKGTGIRLRRPEVRRKR